MRCMNLPELPKGPEAVEGCERAYLESLQGGDAPRPDASVVLTAYCAWPNSEDRRNSFVASYAMSSGRSGGKNGGGTAERQKSATVEMFGGAGAVARVASERLIEEIDELQRKWLWVADIFQLTVDMAYDQGIILRRGSSISKAIDLCEAQRNLPGHSQLRAAWSEFRDVAHLLTAAAHLAYVGLRETGEGHRSSIFDSIWLAPDIVVALAFGLQQFGLEPKPVRKERSLLPGDTLWRVSELHSPEKPFLVHRRLTEEQKGFLNSRKVA